jgi:hypothetical protein
MELLAGISLGIRFQVPIGRQFADDIDKASLLGAMMGVRTESPIALQKAAMASLTDRTGARLSQKQRRERFHAAQRQQVRKARVARRRLGQIHEQLPKQVRAIFDSLEPAFSQRGMTTASISRFR